MSTMSLLDLDRSDGLAKRFAYLASTYFDQPNDAKTTAAKIPLENLFRLLQMFRYDSFSDEPRSGILEFEGLGDQNRSGSLAEHWHDKIAAAIDTALSQVFAGVSKDKAVNQVQAALSWLATNQNPPSLEILARSKEFLERFQTALG